LRGRDFTFNAMAIDLRQPDKIFDPLGGAIDLQHKQLRSCTSSSLEDDPVRVLRAARFATTYQLRIEPQTLQSMHRNVKRLGEVSAERLRDEFFRILNESHPVTCLRVLDRIGALGVLFPELAGLRDLAQSPPHVLDAWEHTLDVVNRLSQVLSVLTEPYDDESASNLYTGLIALRLGRFRPQISELLQSELSTGRTQRALIYFAALFHDAGKPQTRQIDESSRIRFFDHDRVGTEMVSGRAREMRLSVSEIERLHLLVRHHMRPILLANTGSLPSRKAIYRFFRGTGEAGVGVCLLSLADIWGTFGAALPQTVWQNQLDIVRTLLSAWWENPEESVSPPLVINGDELMAGLRIEPGPVVGRLLEEIREAQAMGLVLNTSQALDLARTLLSQEQSDQS
jgi:putative nucleotidyltransferase with HDIG domain